MGPTPSGSVASCQSAVLSEKLSHNPQGASPSPRRSQSSGLIRRAIDGGQTFAREPGVSSLIATDLLRVAGEFDQARQWCDAALATTTEYPEVVTKVLRFERTHIEARDRTIHAIAKAVQEIDKLH